MSDPYQQLRSELETIRERATKVLQRERRRRCTMPALRLGARVSVILALALLSYLGLALLVGLPAGGLSWPVLSGLSLLPGALLAGYLILAAARQPVSADRALAAADRRHDLDDRLRTAAEFLARPQRSPFMAATLLDAADHSHRASDNEFPERHFASASPAAPLGWLSLAVALIVAASWIPTPSLASTDPQGEAEQKLAQLQPIAAKRKPTPSERIPAPKPETPRAATAKQARAETASPSRRDKQTSESEKKTQGVMGSGQSADAASASGKSQARGAPSSQAQASKSGKKSKKKQKTKKPKPTKPQDPAKPSEKPKEESGSTAGRGAASGSNKSPSASPWKSKDQVTSEDEEDIDDDEEVDDEFDNSDARGGVQPHLRDRRPPVNRDLGIGFGNQKNPDANGRGGPSELKKSRGVASLVLGVPIPDHILGRPNPGKTKITQERVEPQAENAGPTDATARTPRQSPIGHVSRPQMMPWMRDLVRSYFQALRRKTQERQPNPPPAK